MSGGLPRIVRLTVEIVGVVLMMIAAMVIFYRHTWRLDLSLGRRYTLSPLAQKVLNTLEKPVRITAFLQDNDPRRGDLMDLLGRVALAAPQISYRALDLTRNPALANEYGIQSYGTLVIECQGQRRNLTNANEASLVGALLAVTRAGRKKIYFSTGHGEKEINSSDRHRGMLSLKRSLVEKVYSVEEIRLIGSDGVPADAALLVVPGPKRDLLPQETMAVEEYIKGGGAVLVLLDPVRLPRLESLLRRFGIAANYDLVVDPAARLAGGEPITFEVSGRSSSHPVIAPLDSGPVFSRARSLEVLDVVPEMESSMLLETSSSAWEQDPSFGEVKFREQAGRQAGPLVVGIATVVGRSAGKRRGRLIVYGDSDFASNLFSSYLGSQDLFLNSVDWLSGEQWLMAAAPHFRRAGIEVFYVTAVQQLTLFWLSSVLEPLAFLAVGVAVFGYRRRRT